MKNTSTHEIQNLRSDIRRLLLIFIVLLVLSGLTALPLETELNWLAAHSALLPDALQVWLSRIAEALTITNARYPFLAYGTDWLAFAHLVIAVAFIGPLKDPVRNRWIIEFGMIACIMVLPFAFICGPIRHIPFYWQLIDSSFGVLGILPLYACYRKINRLEQLTTH